MRRDWPILLGGLACCKLPSDYRNQGLRRRPPQKRVQPVLGGLLLRVLLGRVLPLSRGHLLVGVGLSVQPVLSWLLLLHQRVRVLHLSRRHLLSGFGLRVQPVLGGLLLLLQLDRVQPVRGGLLLHLQLGRVHHLPRRHLLVGVGPRVLHLRRRYLLLDFGLSVHPVLSGDALRDAGPRHSRRMYHLSAGPFLRGWLVGGQHVRGGHL